MDQKNIIILAVVGGVLCLAIGGGLGYFYQLQNGTLPPAESKKVEAVNTLSSKVIPSITAFGQVTNISGRDITLTFGGDSLTIKIKEDAPIYLPATATKDKDGNSVTSAQQTAKFSDIKVGDNASVNLKLLATGQIEGQLVIILGAK